MIPIYLISDGNNQIGVSNLEHADPSMGIRTGQFRPGDGYKLWEPILQELTLASFDERYLQEGTEEKRRLKARIAELQATADALNLRCETQDGTEIPTVWMYLQDAGQELGEEGREVTICVVDSDTYTEFFE